MHDLIDSNLLTLWECRYKDGTPFLFDNYLYKLNNSLYIVNEKNISKTIRQIFSVKYSYKDKTYIIAKDFNPLEVNKLFLKNNIHEPNLYCLKTIRDTVNRFQYLDFLSSLSTKKALRSYVHFSKLL